MFRPGFCLEPPEPPDRVGPQKKSGQRVERPEKSCAVGLEKVEGPTCVNGTWNCVQHGYKEKTQVEMGKRSGPGHSDMDNSTDTGDVRFLSRPEPVG